MAGCSPRPLDTFLWKKFIYFLSYINWLAGGGIKGGTTHGESDEWGYKPLDRDSPTQVYDIHATVLHLLGIDHERLSYYHNGILRRLTNVHGHVIDGILA